MSDLTAEEYRAYALVWWHTNGRMTGAEAVDAANDLEFGAATAALVNELAQILSKQWGDDEWVEVGDPGREEYAGGVRAILAHLRPIAEWLVAEQAWKAKPVNVRPDTLVCPDCGVREPYGERHQCEKPAPRSWPSLDQVPHDVVVRDLDGDTWTHDGAGWCCNGASCAAEGCRGGHSELAPFTEVSA